jgi:DNA topoisomerase IA
VIKAGWTEMMPWKQIDIKDVPNLKKGDTVKIVSVIIFK